MQISKMRKPRIKIIGYMADTEVDLNRDTITGNIHEQNHFIQANDEIQITFVKKISKIILLFYMGIARQYFSKNS